MKKIIFYQCHFHPIGGVETMAYNWCFWLRNFFDVTVLYCSSDPERFKKMSNLVKMELYDQNKIYECDIFIRNSVWGLIPENIKAKRMIEMRHANYKYLLDEGLLYQQYKDMGIKEIVGCGEFVSKMSDEVLHDHPTTIKNILLPTRKTNKVLHLISCTRLDPAKGWSRMLKLMEMMKEAGIKFEWNIFTNSTKYKCSYEEVHFYKQRYDIWDYLADADYTVLLSDSEGLPYTVQESLQYKVPCIVTDVGGCTELIKDGINGYVVPLDMNFDIKKILKIPKCEKYDNGALQGWLNYLGYDKPVTKEQLNDIVQKFKEEKEMRAKVRATKGFEGKFDGERSTETKKVYPKIGEEWITSLGRAEFLKKHGAVEIIEILQEPTEDVFEEFEQDIEIENVQKDIEQASEITAEEKPKKKSTYKRKTAK